MFRKRRAFRGSRPREPKMWDRVPASPASGVNVLNVVGRVVLWDPSTVVAGNQDLRLTLMRLMLDGAYQVNIAGGTTAAGDLYTSSLGIFLGAVGESRDPSLAAAADEKSDWLFLAHFAFPALAAGTAFTFNLQRNIQNQGTLIDVHAKRKVDQDQNLIFVYRLTSPDLINGHAPATAVLNAQLYSSVLYQRTMR